MKPHPRIRKTIKWTGAVVTVLLAVVWIGSYFVVVTRVGANNNWWDISSGCLRFGRAWSPLDLGWYMSWRLGNVPLPVRLGHPQGSIDHLDVPLWLLNAVPLAVSLTAWAFDIRARTRADHLNLCSKCGYDRAGLARGAVCPECGQRS